MTTSWAALGWAQIAQENCYGPALASGQCSLIPEYVVSGLSYAGFYAGFYIPFFRFVRPSWKSIPSKSNVIVLAGLSLLAGAGVSEGAYYLARYAGALAADYATCGGITLPLGCYTYNPFVQAWFILTGCVSGFVAGLILGVRLQGRGTIRASL